MVNIDDWMVSENVRKERLTTCKSCPKLNKIGQCKICFCFVNLKTRLKSEQCPDNPPRWKKEEKTDIES